MALSTLVENADVVLPLPPLVLVPLLPPPKVKEEALTAGAEAAALPKVKAANGFAVVAVVVVVVVAETMAGAAGVAAGTAPNEMAAKGYAVVVEGMAAVV